MPRRTDLETILLIGSGPIVIGQACEFDYSGTQACRVLQGRGLPRRPRELEPGDDHDRPRVRRRHLRRAARRREPRAHHRAGAPGRAAADARRPDRAQPGDRAPRGRRARTVRGRADRRERRSDPHRRGPVAVQGGDVGDRPRHARSRASPTRSRRRSRSAPRSATRSSSARRSSSAAAAPASPHDADELRELAAERGLDASPVVGDPASSSRSSGGRSTSSR